MTDTPHHDVLIVTGMSGAGRSTVANALEDLGWYVVDNLPPQMLRPLVDLAVHPGNALPAIAAVVDVRGGRLFADLVHIVHELRSKTNLRVLFLEATDDALVRRFEQVRRPHPLQEDGTLLDGIARERQRMLEVRELSDIVIDTTSFNIHQLATTVSDIFAPQGTADVKLTVESFGFKYGLPTDVDMVADVRFLPNPFWNEDLRPFTGRDAVVRDYVFAQEGAQEFLDAYLAALKPVLAGYARENKRHATFAVGCTGGKHRSVAMVEEVARRLAELQGIAVTVKHRDAGRE